MMCKIATMTGSWTRKKRTPPMGRAAAATVEIEGREVLVKNIVVRKVRRHRSGYQILQMNQDGAKSWTWLHFSITLRRCRRLTV
ncbi:MAG: hypothetical protein VCB26_04570 [Candidatus Hydrogenedentota bacterium]